MSGWDPLRVAIEHLLDHVAIPRRQRTKKGYEQMTLHRRIEAISKTQGEVGSSLMAIKWLGNTGSHESEVAMPDLLKGYEIMEHVLDVLLSGRAKRASSLAKDLTKRHAKRKRRKK